MELFKEFEKVVTETEKLKKMVNGEVDFLKEAGAKKGVTDRDIELLADAGVQYGRGGY